MSTENEENNIKQNNNIDYANLDKNELVKQNAFVKDLVVKLDVLKKGVVDERKKTALLISKIKQLEEELNNKNNEIKKLSQEKLNPEEQTSSNNNNDTPKKVEDKKSEMALILAKEEIRKLNEQIINLQ